MPPSCVVPVAEYLRASTEHQHYSLQNQADRIQAYAQQHGFEIVQTYSDAARSGISLKDRPELMRLLSDVVSGDAIFKAILVYDVSRWGRFQDSDEAAHYEFLCKRSGVPVHYCAENFLNDNTPTSSVLKALKRTMAAEYSREMGVRIYAGEKRGAELGFKQGGKPGYALRRLMVSAEGQPRKILALGELKSLRTDRVILVPGPTEEVACVREIYRLVIDENRTPYNIAAELNRRHVTCPSGKWTQQLVNRILTDPKYAGYNVWNRSSSRLGSPTIRKSKSQWVLRPAAFQAIIDPRLFKQAQRALAEQRQPYTNEELLEILRALLKRHGMLSYRILHDTAHVPAANTFTRAFGSLRRAFEFAGQRYETAMPTDEQLRTANHFRDNVLAQVLCLFPGQVSLVRPRAGGPDYLDVSRVFMVSVVVCPAVRRNNRTEWFADPWWTQGTTVTLLARLDPGNAQLRDYYVQQRPRYRWIRLYTHPEKRQLARLLDFCSAVQGIARRAPDFRKNNESCSRGDLDAKR